MTKATSLNQEVMGGISGKITFIETWNVSEI